MRRASSRKANIDSCYSFIHASSRQELRARRAVRRSGRIRPGAAVAASRSRPAAARPSSGSSTPQPLLLEEGGVDAVTTRAIAERAGITAPSLYRFFADREQVLDALIEQHLERLSDVPCRGRGRLDAVVSDRVRGSASSASTSLTSGPTATPPGCGWTGASHRPCARRCCGTTSGPPSACTAWPSRPGSPAQQADPLVFVMVVELGDRILDLAFRERRDPDPDVIRQGRVALTAYLTAALDDSATPRSGAPCPRIDRSPPHFAAGTRPPPPRADHL